MPTTNHNTPGQTAGKNHLFDFARAQDNLDLREFWRTLKRQKILVLGIIGTILLLTLIFTLLSSPMYRATASMQVEREAAKIVDVNFMNTGDIRDTRDFYQTQFELIKSYALIERVIDSLKLDHTVIRRSLPGKIKDLFTSNADMNNKIVLANAIMENLNVEPVNNSRLVKVHFDGANPQKAADIANAIVNTFVDMNMEHRFQKTGEAQRFLQDRIKDARVKLQETETALNEFAREKGIIKLDDKDSSTSTHTIMRLSEELVKAESEAILIKTDRSRANELAAAKERAELLRDALAKEQAHALDLQDHTLTYNTLEREVATNQALYQGLLQRLKEINVAGGEGSSNLLVIDKALAPLRKFKPNMTTNLIFASLLGLFIGVAAAFTREFMDDSVKDVNDLERQTHLPVLGIIPAARESDPKKLAQLVLNSPKSTLAESFRSLRTTLRFKLRESNGPGILFITSSRANEGKTTVAMNLASAFAHSGNKVLLIDADLRNPSLHRLMGTNEKRGLVSYLSGESGLEGLTQSSNVPNLDLILAGIPPHDPSELLSNPKMEALLKTASQHYDIVIMDGPPILGLADAMILSTLATLTILTVHTGETRTPTVVNALKRLHESGARVSGLLLNQVKDSGRLGYGEDYYSYPSKP